MISAVRVIDAMKSTTTTPYTIWIPRMSSAPAMAGPAIRAVCMPIAVQATALPKCSIGTRRGTIACREGA